MTDFFVKFEALYNRLSKFDVKLPEGVQCFFLLNAANVTEENERLARATSSGMTYSAMKLCLQKIFGDPSAGNLQSGVPEVKCESVLLSGCNHYNNTERYGQNRRSGRGRWYGNKRQQNNKEGYRCYNCDSTEHLVKFCPKPRQKQTFFVNEQSSSEQSGGSGSHSKANDNTVFITLQCSADSFSSTLVKESLGKCLLDTGCAKTVCGELWLTEYLATLTEKEKSLVSTKPCNIGFRFGDGIEFISTKLVTFPAIFGKVKVLIDANVVKNEILSQSPFKSKFFEKGVYDNRF